MNGSALPSRQANSNVLNSYDKPRINETRNRRPRPNKDQNNWAQGGIALLVCIRQVSAQDRPFCYNLQLHVFTEIGGGGFHTQISSYSGQGHPTNACNVPGDIKIRRMV